VTRVTGMPAVTSLLHARHDYLSGTIVNGCANIVFTQGKKVAAHAAGAMDNSTDPIDRAACTLWTVLHVVR
jgi:hypothetical protein